MPDAVMLFAAGFGTRMGALTRDRPKPLIEVAGRTLLDHALDIAAHVPRRVVNAHYKAGMIVDHLAGSDVRVSVEAPDILDTGGGLRAALPLLQRDPVFTLNTDAIWRGKNPLAHLAQAWEPDRMDALLLCIPHGRAHGRDGGGDFTMTPEGLLHRAGPLVYTGAQVLKTKVLDSAPAGAFGLNQVWDRIAAEGRLAGTVYAGEWCDVGHPGGIALAETMLEAGDV